jgi:hypothetical protein
MGATNFYTEAEGKTFAEAFSNAVREARHWHGHGGYSGTIAEKPSAVQFSIPLSALPEATEDTRFSLGQRVDNAIAHYSYEGDKWLTSESKYPHERQAQIDAKALIASMGKPAFIRLANTWDQKWDDAVGFSVGEGKFAFCGMASC